MSYPPFLWTTIAHLLSSASYHIVYTINELQRSFIRICPPYYHQAVLEGKEDTFIASFAAMYHSRWPVKRGEIDNLSVVIALERDITNVSLS